MTRYLPTTNRLLAVSRRGVLAMPTLALSCFSGAVSAQTPSPEDHLVRSRAVEAVIWGMPVVNYDLMLQEMLTKIPGKVNQVIYWGKPLDSHNQTLKNDLNAYSLNNITANKNADGSITVQFGGCDGKVPNCLPIMKGWNYTVRLYRPQAEILNGTWKFPEPKPAS